MSARVGRNLLGAAIASCLAVAAVAANDSRASELVFFLQYLGTDYGAAVGDGTVVDAAEYEELVRLSGDVLDRYRELRPGGSAFPELARLRDLVRNRAPWETVRAQSGELVLRIVDELEVVSYPLDGPDLERGRVLYGEDCAACHGTVGGGDGPSSPGMVPTPTSFRAARMTLVSPHQVFNAESFGVNGTAMPAYREALAARELWDIAFFVMTLRDGFDPSIPAETVPLTLADVASKSDQDLLVQLRKTRPGAQAAELDYYRTRLRRTKAPEQWPEPVAGEDALEVAAVLERTFAGVADRVFPAVVGVSVYTKAPPAAAAGKAGGSGKGWAVGDVEEQLYPGFHRVRSGTGFLVSGDGDVLTCADVLTRLHPATKNDVVDVELTGNIHCRARVIGIEPTVDLAVLKIVAPIPLRPATLGDSDSVRVGHWAIAMGDPPGPAKQFVPGSIAGRPERECYQEHRTSTLFQSSITMDPAGFGGPLVNIRGEVIGLTVPEAGIAATAPATRSRVVSALPINLVMTLYRALKVKESEESPWLGMSVLDLSSRLRSRLKSSPLTGLYIEDVFDPSPASHAGIRAGDVLTKIDDHPMLGVSDFQTWIYLLGIDTTVTLEIFRDGQTLQRKATIEQRPASAVSR